MKLHTVQLAFWYTMGIASGMFATLIINGNDGIQQNTVCSQVSNRMAEIGKKNDYASYEEVYIGGSLFRKKVAISNGDESTYYQGDAAIKVLEE